MWNSGTEKPSINFLYQGRYMDDQLYNDKHDRDLDAANDTFLLAEGLELLSDFRSIKDPEVRTKIKELVGLLNRMQTKRSCLSE